MNQTLVQSIEAGDYRYAADLSANGWHLAERLRDHAIILVSSNGQQAYVFRESLLGTAVQPYEVQ